MHPLAKKLLVSRQLQMEEGDLRVLGDNMIILPADVLLEFNELLDEKIVYRIGEIIGDRMASTLKKYGISGMKLVDFCLNLMSMYGWGKPSIVRVGEKTFLMVEHSVIALKAIEKQKKYRCCGLLAGIFAGLFSNAMGKKMTAREVKCFALGEKFCEFEIF